MDLSEQYARHSLNRVAFSATAHCLAGCSIGEVLGMAVGTALSLSTTETIALSIVLAFLFGYSLTMVPLLRGGIAFQPAMKLAFAADSLVIAALELVDNGVMFAIPGATEAGLTDPLFWGSLVTSLILAGIAAFPVTRWLISRVRPIESNNPARRLNKMVAHCARHLIAVLNSAGNAIRLRIGRL